MYKRFKIWMGLAIAVLVVACQKDLVLGGTDHIVLGESTTVTLVQEGETKLVDVSSLGDEWQIEYDTHNTWLTAIRRGTTLELTATANNEADERRTEVTIATPTSKQTITITQFGTEPTIAVDGSNGTLILNHEAHTGVELKIISNSDNWTVEQLDTANNNWLSYAVDLKQRKLTLNLTAIERNSPWAQTSRSEKLFLSNGNRHYELTIMQNGFVQFQLPVWDFDNFDINKVIAMEAERHNLRDKAFEIDSLLPYHQDQKKVFTVFHSPGEQAPHILYQQKNYGTDMYCAWLKAPKGKLFQQESYEPWLKQNNFKLGNKQRLDTESQYYNEEIDRTRLLTIYNSVDNFKMAGGIFRSACMKYQETSNSLKLNSDGKAETFPVFPSDYLHNKAFKLDQVVAFERQRGMKPDYYNQFNSENVTATTEDPLCRYSRLIFVPENESYEPGTLAYVIYFFNWQGITEEDIDAGLVQDKDLSGTVGSCQVFYQGGDVFYTREEQGTPGVYSWYEYSLPFSTRRAIEDKGYSLFREASGGFATFYRGSENLIDLRPQESRTVITYYKSKHYVDLIKKNLNY